MRENGRSMVEMLGVLAIIGVLSVGAIAGYSKAMLKYKLNILSQSLTQLVQSYVTLLPQLQHEQNTTHNFIKLADELNLLPEHFKNRNGIGYDIFNSYIVFLQSTAGQRFVFAYTLSDDMLSEELCRQILTTMQPWSSFIGITFLQRDYGNDSGYESDLYDSDAFFSADNGCSSKYAHKCLAQATLTDFNKACSKFCDTEYGKCSLHFQFYFNPE